MTDDNKAGDLERLSQTIQTLIEIRDKLHDHESRDESATYQAAKVDTAIELVSESKNRIDGYVGQGEWGTDNE